MTAPARTGAPVPSLETGTAAARPRRGRRVGRSRSDRARTMVRGAVPILLFLLIWEVLPLLLTPTARIFLPQFHAVVAA